MMKWTVISSVTPTSILFILWLAVGGDTLAIALGVLGAVSAILATFSLGIWYAHKSIQLGAKLATEAQNNNDKWDTVKMQSLAQFGGQMAKVKDQQNGFKLIESDNDFDQPFMITGIGDE